MKRLIACLGIALLALSAPSVWARGFHTEVIIGPIGPWVYYPGPVYYPPAYVVPQATVAPAPVYIQQDPAVSAPSAPPAAAPAAPAPSYYFCPASKAYYPYVQSCPSGWQRVAPQPPGAPQ